VINRLDLAADFARGSPAATGGGRGSNIGEAFQRRPRSRTQHLVGIDNVVTIIGPSARGLRRQRRRASSVPPVAHATVLARQRRPSTWQTPGRTLRGLITTVGQFAGSIASSRPSAPVTRRRKSRASCKKTQHCWVLVLHLPGRIVGKSDRSDSAQVYPFYRSA
jgi:hypothetical protein